MRELGHQVRVCYAGFEDLNRELRDETDMVFIGAFTRSAQAAYAISNLYRSRGTVTVLVGWACAAIRKTRRSISTMSSVSPTRR